MNDLSTLERLVNDILELGPMTVSWDALDRRPPRYEGARRFDSNGFQSVDHALNTLTDRLVGMRCALTTNTDLILTAEQRELRDGIVLAFLDKIRLIYIEGLRQ